MRAGCGLVRGTPGGTRSVWGGDASGWHAHEAAGPSDYLSTAPRRARTAACRGDQPAPRLTISFARLAWRALSCG